MGTSAQRMQVPTPDRLFSRAARCLDAAVVADLILADCRVEVTITYATSTAAFCNLLDNGRLRCPVVQLSRAPPLTDDLR